MSQPPEGPPWGRALLRAVGGPLLWSGMFVGVPLAVEYADGTMRYGPYSDVLWYLLVFACAWAVTIGASTLGTFFGRQWAPKDEQRVAVVLGCALVSGVLGVVLPLQTVYVGELLRAATVEGATQRTLWVGLRSLGDSVTLYGFVALTHYGAAVSAVDVSEGRTDRLFTLFPALALVGVGGLGSLLLGPRAMGVFFFVGAYGILAELSLSWMRILDRIHEGVFEDVARD